MRKPSKLKNGDGTVFGEEEDSVLTLTTTEAAPSVLSRQEDAPLQSNPPAGGPLELLANRGIGSMVRDRRRRQEFSGSWK